MKKSSQSPLIKSSGPFINPMAQQRRTLYSGVSAIAGVMIAALIGISTFTSAAEPSGQKSVPVLLELFTSEGCSSCPPADLLLTELLELQPFDNVELIAVGQHVDYWDRLGWKDPYGSPALSERQRQYARNRGDRKVYTPQLVVNGQSHVVGSQPEKVFDAIERVRNAEIKPLQLNANTLNGKATITISNSSLSSLSQSRIKLTFAVVQDEISSDVKSGENSGRQLQHSAVARALKSIIVEPSSSDFQYSLKLPSDTRSAMLRAVVFAQNPTTDELLAVGQINLAG